MIGLVSLGSDCRWPARPGDRVAFDPGNGSLALGTIEAIDVATAQYRVIVDGHFPLQCVNIEDVVWRKASRS